LFVAVATAGTAAVATAAVVCDHSRRRTPASARVCPADTTEQCWTAEWRLAAGTGHHWRCHQWSRVGC